MEEQHEEASKIGSALAALRRRVTKPCEVCGTMMENVMAKQRYCSTRCLSRAVYARRKAELLAYKKEWRERRKTEAQTG